MNIVVYLVVIGCGIWVYFDAKAIGAKKGLTDGFLNMGPIGWTACTMLLWIIAFPLYLIKRGDIKAMASGEVGRPVHQNNESKPTVLNSIAKYTALGWSFFCIVGSVYGLIAVGDLASKNTEAGMQAGMAIGAGIGMTMWFFVWVAVTLPATVIFFLTKKSGNVINQPPAQPIISDDETKKCPYCAETIQKEAKLCRFCKQDLSEDKPTDVKKEPPIMPPDLLSISKKHLQKGEYKEAVVILTRLINTDINNSTAYYLRAIAFSKMKDKKNMLVDLEKSAKLGNKKAQESLAKLKRNASKAA